MIRKKQLLERIKNLEKKCNILENELCSRNVRDAELLEGLNIILGYNPMCYDPIVKPCKTLEEAIVTILRNFKKDIQFNKEQIKTIKIKEFKENTEEVIFDFDKFVKDLFMPEKKKTKKGTKK